MSNNFSHVGHFYQNMTQRSGKFHIVVHHVQQNMTDHSDITTHKKSMKLEH